MKGADAREAAATLEPVWSGLGRANEWDVAL